MTPDSGALFEFGPFRLDVAEHMLLRDGQPVPLTPKNFAVLRILVQNGGHLVEKERLLKEVWPDSFVEEGALNRSVSVLRKTLGEGSAGHRYIETIPKRGYRFVALVRNVPAIAAVPGVQGRRPRKTTQIAVVCLAAAALAAIVIRFAQPQSPRLPFSGPSHRQLTFSGKEGFPSLSPDGRLIAYVSDDKPEKRVFVQDLGGGQPREIFAAPEVGHLRWSPDGSELIVWARGSARNGIHAVQYPSGTSRLIAAGRYVACWSPDGTTIAVASYLDGRLWFFDRSGVEQRSFPLHDVRWSIWDLDWSAANGLLLFVGSDYQGRYTIQTVQADGTNQQTVLSDTAEIPSVRWSADGKAIYYFRRQNQTDSLLRLALEPGAATLHAVPTTLIAGWRRIDLWLSRRTESDSYTPEHRTTPISGLSKQRSRLERLAHDGTDQRNLGHRAAPPLLRTASCLSPLSDADRSRTSTRCRLREARRRSSRARKASACPACGLRTDGKSHLPPCRTASRGSGSFRRRVEFRNRCRPVR